MSRARAIGSHQSAVAKTTTWLTPPAVLAALGGWQSFDMDPCAAPLPRPWPTARTMNREMDGLTMEWDGRVFLNPPYTSAQIGQWLAKMADHDRGTALIFARTETEHFERHIWARAAGLLFLYGRLHFHRLEAPHPDRCATADHVWMEYAPKAFACSNCGRSKDNAGAPSVLCAYGADDMDRLAASELQGAFVPLRFARFVMVAGLDLSWSDVMREWISRQSGPVRMSDAYRYFARHPKAARNLNWKAKVRQKLPLVARRIQRDYYVAVT